MQAYDMDLRTIQIFYATLSSVFPHIETWQTQSGDLLLIASRNILLVHDIGSLSGLDSVGTFPERARPCLAND